MVVITTQNISKRFNDVLALNDISLHINKGAVFGLVGTNGAGKSTFLRLLAGIYRPDSGSITIDDQPVWENNEVKRRICYISDEQYFSPMLRRWRWRVIITAFIPILICSVFQG